MCGIIGYKGGKNASAMVVEGLKSLEYRGYDSYGLCFKNNGSLNLIKKVGRIGDVSADSFPSSNLCIGHTRWGTTGSVTKENAHPHLSQNKKIAVVHNGIIENYQELRDFLKEKGFKFLSETDTEVIPHLVQHFTEKEEEFRDAFRHALLKLEGSFAVVAVHESSRHIFFGRRGSPLVIGVGENDFFVASDVPAFLEHTRRVLYLEDNEYGFVNDKVSVFDLQSDKEVERESKEISWDLEQAKKGDFPYFMLKEISEQKFTVERAIEQDRELMSKVTSMIRDSFGVFFVGCGTSYHACVSASYIFSKVAKKHINVVLASEFSNYKDFLTDKTLMIAVSQSGETADLLDAVKAAKSKGVKVISIVNVMGSTLTRICDENIMMNAGPEICVLSTKSYTSQIAILMLLAFSVAGRIGEGRELVRKASSFIPGIIDENIEKLKNLAVKQKGKNDMFLIGRDLAFPSALEGALKIKEVSYIHAEGFAGGELKHGTISLIEKGVPAIVFSTGATRQFILSNAAEIKARGGYIIGIDSVENETFDYFIRVPDVSYANPILMIIPIQIFSYYLALERGCDPDKPRNLAKSVCVR